MGCSFAGPYALQGSWAAVGPNKIVLAPVLYGGGLGAPGESDYTLRFYMRTPSTAMTNPNTWQLKNSISIKTLVADNAGTNPLYIPGCGLVYKEGDNAFASGRNNTRSVTYVEINFALVPYYLLIVGGQQHAMAVPGLSVLVGVKTIGLKILLLMKVGPDLRIYPQVLPMPGTQ